MAPAIREADAPERAQGVRHAVIDRIRQNQAALVTG
jgi:hypothetical protein